MTGKRPYQPTDFEALEVGPYDFLVLVTRRESGALTFRDIERMKSQLPDSLRDRVLFVDGMDAAVVRTGAPDER